MNPLAAAIQQMKARGAGPGPGGPGGPPMMPQGMPHPGMGPGGPPPGMPMGPPGMGGPPGMQPGMGGPPGAMNGMGVSPMSPMGMPDQKTTLLHNMVNMGQAYLQMQPMDENTQRVAGAVRELMMVLTGGMSMPDGSIHGSVTPPSGPPDPGGDHGGGGIPNPPEEVL